MYNTILVPLDGSKRAEKILPYVEELALRRESTVVFLQVVEQPIEVVEAYGAAAYIERDLGNRTVAAVKSYLASLVGEMREKGMAAKCVVECGPVVRTILNVAEREKTNLIAMASHGRTGLARAFYGSVAAGVLQQTERPLLLIRTANSQ